MRNFADIRVRVPHIFGWRFAFAIALVASALAGTSPKDSLVATSISVVGVVVLGLLWFARGRVRRDLSMIGLIVLMFSLIIALPWSMLNEITIRDYFLRGIAPVVFLGVGFLLPLSTRADCEFVLKIILLSCYCWAFQVAIALAGSFDETLLQRWTVLSRDLLLPFNLVAIGLLLFHPRIQMGVTRIVGLVVFAVLTIGGGYRIQLFIVAVVVIGAVAYALRHGRVFVPLVVLAAIGLFVAWFVTTESGYQLVERLASLGAERESARAMEIKFAFEKFLESPVIGNGLPYPVPVEVTFFGREDYLFRVGSQFESYSHVAYVHNVIMYVMMNLGLVGLFGLGLFMAGIFVSVRADSTSLLSGPGRVGAVVACLAMFIHSLVAATFTLFPFNFMLSCLVAVLAARTRALI